MVDTSKFAKTSDWPGFRSDIDKLDMDKFEKMRIVLKLVVKIILKVFYNANSLKNKVVIFDVD